VGGTGARAGGTGEARLARDLEEDDAAEQEAEGRATERRRVGFEEQGVGDECQNDHTLADRGDSATGTLLPSDRGERNVGQKRLGLSASDAYSPFPEASTVGGTGEEGEGGRGRHWRRVRAG